MQFRNPFQESRLSQRPPSHVSVHSSSTRQEFVAKSSQPFESPLQNAQITGDALVFASFVVIIFLFIFMWCGLARIRMKQTEGRLFLDRNSGYKSYWEKKNKEK